MDPAATHAATIRLADAMPASPQVPGSFSALLSASPGWSFSHSGLGNTDVLQRLTVMDEVRDDLPNRRHRRLRLHDPDVGLVVDVDYIWHVEHNAVIYGAALRNESDSVIPHITGLLSTDITIENLQQIGSPFLHTTGGGVTHYHYPPEAFRLREEQLLGPTSITIDSGPTGRSSNKDLPFFLIEEESRSSGLFGGIEWSGLWRYTLRRRDEPNLVHYGHLGPEKDLTISGGITGVDVTLNPGESFEMPRALVGFYEGSIDDGRNRLRRFLIDWAPPGWTAPRIQATPGGYMCPPDLTTAEQCLENARAVAEIGAEYYVIECWFTDAPSKARVWGATGSRRGSWHPEKSRFPDLKQLADDIRATGLKFGLWTDMEVVHGASEVAREHPEWVLYLPEPDPAGGDEAPGLLNLGIPAAQDWAIATYDRLVADYGIEWVFYDNNVDPAPYWEANETKHRRGWLQHNYIRGVWRVWDEIRRRHPDVVLENCSSGGRRIDLGTIGHAHCHFSSDQFRHAPSIRYQQMGAGAAVPSNQLLSFLCLGLDDYPDATLHSFFTGGLCITEGVENWSQELRRKVARHIDIYKSVRHLLSKDYYLLLPQPSALGAWEAWQFHDPSGREGFAVVIAGTSERKPGGIGLRGLDRAKAYEITDPYGNRDQVTASGDELSREGLHFELSAGESAIVRYRQIMSV